MSRSGARNSTAARVLPIPRYLPSTLETITAGVTVKSSVLRTARLPEQPVAVPDELQHHYGAGLHRWQRPPCHSAQKRQWDVAIWPPEYAGKHNFQYGILEASIQLPIRTNQACACIPGALGSNITTVPWPACGEADIMENWSPQVLNGAGPSGNNSTIHTAQTGGSGVGRRFHIPQRGGGKYGSIRMGHLDAK